MLHAFFSAFIVLTLSASVFADTSLRVVVISIDGGNPDVIKQVAMPNYEALFRSGAATFKATTIVPSITLPSHTSMLSGMGPSTHNVLWNHWRPEVGPLQIPTMFSIARAAGKKTALVAGKEKFLHFNAPGTLDHFKWVTGDALATAEEAIHVLRELKPELLFVHFKDADSVGHQHGWGSPEQHAALRDIDTGLAMITRTISDLGFTSETVLIVTADHGGKGKNHWLPIGSNRKIPWIISGPGIQKGITLQGDIDIVDTAAMALHMLGIEIPAGWNGRIIKDALSGAVDRLQFQLLNLGRLTGLAAW